MIFPCSNCKGSGKVFYPNGGPHGVGNRGVCPTCKDVPWLPAHYFTPYMEQTYLFDKYAPEDAPEWWKQDERGKPDPSTVMRWCDVHKAVGTGEICQAWDLVSRRIGRNPFNRITCRIMWIDLPTPLQDAT